MKKKTCEYGVQNKYDPTDTEWYESMEEAEAQLEEANSYVLVEREKE